MTTVELCPYCHTKNIEGIEGDFDSSHRIAQLRNNSFIPRDGGTLLKLNCHGCKVSNIWPKEQLEQVIKLEKERV